MCGITGLFSTNSCSGEAVKSMADILRHRGPDDEGYVAIQTAEGLITPLGGTDSQVSLPDISHFGEGADLYLAHRRLSIIDLSPAGHQPMGYDNGHLWVTYNGELYNYLDIRKELEKLGHTFQTRTDTEVLLAAYLEWGEECLDRFDGMWAFVLYDRRRNLLFGSRDRFGVKPLYYVKKSGVFAFASEVKAFAALPGFNGTVRSEAVFDYLAFGRERWDDGTTFLEEVMELSPSHAFRFDLKEKTLQIYRYYTLPYNDGALWEPFCEKKAAEHVEKVRELVFASVRRHLSSDVPVGSCLSGGIDSSAIFGAIGTLLKSERIAEVGERPKAFTACYDDTSIDESAWARLAAEHTGGEWHTVYPQGDELIEDLEDLIYTQDFPFGSTSIYAQYRVMKLAKERGVTVLLDGQGGDELFTGYTPYYVAFFREMLGKGAWSDLAREWRALGNAPVSKQGVVSGLLNEMGKRHLPRYVKKKIKKSQCSVMEYLSSPFRDKHYAGRMNCMVDSLPGADSLNDMLACLMTSPSLQRLLCYEDRNSMRFQVESRTPFADDRALIESVFLIPPAYKIYQGFSKWLLREAMKPVLPKKIYSRTDKIGFATPEFLWLCAENKRFKEMVLHSSNPFLDTPKIREEWDFLIKNQSRTGVTTLFRFITFAMWLKKFFS